MGILHTVMCCTAMTYRKETATLKVVYNVLKDSEKGCAGEYRYGFQDQEKVNEIYGEGNAYSFKYRMYNPRLGKFFSVDPLDKKYPAWSPYAFAMDRVIDGIELEGLEWKPVKDDNGTTTDYNWVGDKGRDEDGNLKDGIVEAAVIFWGSESEKLGEGDNLFGKGAKLAKAKVYGPDGPDDIKEYDAYTMSSDPEKYGTVANGAYNVNYDEKGKSGALKSHWAVEGRGRVAARGGVNPAHTERNPGYLTGVFIHRSNNSGYAGGHVSEGCLLIVPSYNNSGNGWDEFNQQLDGVSSFQMIMNRDYSPPIPKMNYTVPADNTYVAPPVMPLIKF